MLLSISIQVKTKHMCFKRQRHYFTYDLSSNIYICSCICILICLPENKNKPPPIFPTTIPRIECQIMQASYYIEFSYIFIEYI